MPQQCRPHGIGWNFPVQRRFQHLTGSGQLMVAGYRRRHLRGTGQFRPAPILLAVAVRNSPGCYFCLNNTRWSSRAARPILMAPAWIYADGVKHDRGWHAGRCSDCDSCVQRDELVGRYDERRRAHDYSSGATLNIPGPDTVYLSSRTVENGGTILWTGAANIYTLQ